MVVLTRKVGEELVIDAGGRVVILAVQGDNIYFGIQGSPSIEVDRKPAHSGRYPYADCCQEQEPSPLSLRDRLRSFLPLAFA